MLPLQLLVKVRASQRSLKDDHSSEGLVDSCSRPSRLLAWIAQASIPQMWLSARYPSPERVMSEMQLGERSSISGQTFWIGNCRDSLTLRRFLSWGTSLYMLFLVKRKSLTGEGVCFKGRNSPVID